jgi:hypothetical protein
MIVDDLFRKLERKTEMDLLNQATQTAFKAQNKAIGNVTNPKKGLINFVVLAREFLWFFAALAIGFIIGFLFYELFSFWLMDAKKDLISMLFITESNFLYFLSAICFLGVYIIRLTIWALKLVQL